jgi:hypothetical protein
MSNNNVSLFTNQKFQNISGTQAATWQQNPAADINQLVQISPSLKLDNLLFQFSRYVQTTPASNGTACFKKCKQLFEYRNLLLHLVVKVLIYI